jgi:MFS family permease
MVVFCLGVVLQTIAVAIPLFTAGRFFAGYGVGMVSALIPLYQSETAPKWIRGTVVGAYQLAITIVSIAAHRQTRTPQAYTYIGSSPCRHCRQRHQEPR